MDIKHKLAKYNTEDIRLASAYACYIDNRKAKSVLKSPIMLLYFTEKLKRLRKKTSHIHTFCHVKKSQCGDTVLQWQYTV